MSEVAHKCYRCPKILKFEDYQERHYKYYEEDGVRIRTVYFMICEECAKERKNVETREANQQLQSPN